VERIKVTEYLSAGKPGYGSKGMDTDLVILELTFWFVKWGNGEANIPGEKGAEKKAFRRRTSEQGNGIEFIKLTTKVVTTNVGEKDKSELTQIKT
jgi:hypothetical protein